MKMIGCPALRNQDALQLHAVNARHLNIGYYARGAIQRETAKTQRATQTYEPLIQDRTRRFGCRRDRFIVVDD